MYYEKDYWIDTLFCSARHAAYAGDFQSAGIGDAAGHSQVTYPIQAFKDLLSICSIC